MSESPEDAYECVEGLVARHNALTRQLAAKDKALREIIKGEGCFSKDNYEFACNTIEAMKAIATAALATPPEPLGAPAMRGWRHIETAPKDGTLVLLCNANDRTWPMRCRRWQDDHWRGDDRVIEDATHWMPLPDPPASGA